MSEEQQRLVQYPLKPSGSNFFGQSGTGSALSEGLGSDGVVGRLPKDNIRVRIRQRSSRLLSLLGLKNPTQTVKPDNSRGTGSGSSEAEGTPQQDAFDRCKTYPDNFKPLPINSADSPASPAQAPKQAEGETPDEGTASPKFLDLKRSQSTPVELARIVSMKLSTTFGSPTVIHRSHLNLRPSVQALHFQASLNTPGNSNPPVNVNPNGSSGSSTPSSKGSPGDSLSTAPTSVSPGSSQPSGDGNNCQAIFFKHHTSHANLIECPLSPVSETPVISPSILTAEAAANAKVFFETYFHTLYSGVDTRNQRQLELDQYILTLPLSPDEKAKVKKQWVAQEREYLRQCRVLKSRSHGQSSRDETPSLAGFEVIKILGRGSFGVVRLVREKDADCPPSHATGHAQSGRAPLTPKSGHRQAMTGMKKDVFAMKVIRKSVMIRNSQEGHLRAERDFLVASSKSRWIVPLIASFQDHSYLYLVMDYMVGGDFLGLLVRHNILAEDIARWYVAEMILCIEEAHRLHWIHRDVKPDNFLISASGHLKISDFGLAFDGHWAHDQWYFTYQRHSLLKRLGIQVHGDAEDQKESQDAHKQSPGAAHEDGFMDDDWIHPPTNGLLGWRDKNQKRRMARSVVGTSQYMAPEVIRGHPYDGRCDWWSIGIILYECLYGFTPFASEDRHKTKMKIHHHLQTLYFPVHRPTDKLVSAEAIDVINSLLQEREFRLSSNKYKSNDTLTARPTKCFFYKPDGSNQNYQGLYVYPNDAADIKSHTFFRGINWDEIHRMSPPFVPKVRGWEDTRYFEDGEYPTDHDDESTDSEAYQGNEGVSPGGNGGLHRLGPPSKNDVRPSAHLPGNDGTKDNAKPPAKGKKKHQEPRRPRDKILRDKRLRRTVLEMRKKGAFLGYTYRRPKGVIMALTPERGRPYISRGQLSELYR